MKETLIQERLENFVMIVVSKAISHLTQRERMQIISSLDLKDLNKILQDYTIKRNTK